MDRLRQRADFLAVANGARVNSPAFVLQSRRRDDGGPIRIGFTVTRKNGTATERNRIRRRLRTAIDGAAVDHSGRNADVVVVGRRPVLGAPHELLIEDLRRALAVVTRPKPARGPARPVDTPATSAEALSTGGERRGSPHA
jgi:ribonuclease P protein component